MEPPVAFAVPDCDSAILYLTTTIPDPPLPPSLVGYAPPPPPPPVECVPGVPLTVELPVPVSYTHLRAHET